MHFCLYTSRARIAPDDPAHADILAVARRNNAALGVTGFLHREGGHFIQYLEGPKAAIDHLLPVISCDPRHGDLTVQTSGALDAPRLGDWQIAWLGDDALSLGDLLALPDDDGPLQVDDPFDLIVFMIANASFRRGTSHVA
ncbi:BLUF domain-containing protein [Pseudaestuariivita atlantica]|uniref:BLUF domain-containing protein n=1 Tax=Pseudaestuariivita atlantica TaxID=1317121 RepID=A0A0L1JU36_9RHOB|nr:BLUF domain-containing protein [Pseudaestuariivita atlantica]KNG95202.1 hypothetical protein ATO11_00735 [Pseudaestuariivita atlantica]